MSIDILQEHSTMRKKKINELQTMTRGQMEADISKALISFEKEHMGRGPVEAGTYIIHCDHPPEGHFDPCGDSSGKR